MRALIIVAALLAASPTWAWPVRGGGGTGGSPPGTCAYGTTYSDGCPAATGLFTQSNFSTYARISGQTWTSAHPWDWNAPGVDYGVGNTTALATHVDPVSGGALPAGCAYSATGGLIGPRVNCNLTVDTTIQNLNLSGNSLTGYGHACVNINIASATAGITVTFLNNYFENDPACLNTYTGGDGTSWLFASTTLAGGANFVFKNNTFIGHGTDPTMRCPGAQSITCSDMQIGKGLQTAGVTTDGTVVYQYNYISQWLGQTYGFSAKTSCPGNAITIQYNYMDGNHTAVPQGHGAFGSMTCSNPGQILYNTVLYRPGAYDTMLLTSPISISTTNVTSQDVTVSGNLIVVNGPVGITNPANVTAGVTIAGNTVTINSLSGGGGKVGPGSFLGSGTGTQGTGSLNAALAENLGGGNGVGSTWRYDCAANPLTGNPVGLAVCFPITTGAPAYYHVNQQASGGSGVDPGTFTSVATTNVTAQSVLSGPHGTFHDLFFTHNYVDNTGVSDAPPLIFTNGGMTCTGVTTVSGNVSLLTGSAYNWHFCWGNCR